MKAITAVHGRILQYLRSLLLPTSPQVPSPQRTLSPTRALNSLPPFQTLVVLQHQDTVIKPNGNLIVNMSHTFTSNGTKYIRVCADADARGPSNTGATGTVTESNEGNNCGSWTDITVSPIVTPADLTASSVTPTNAVSNQSTQFSATISNIGGTATSRYSN